MPVLSTTFSLQYNERFWWYPRAIPLDSTPRTARAWRKPYESWWSLHCCRGTTSGSAMLGQLSMKFHRELHRAIGFLSLFSGHVSYMLRLSLVVWLWMLWFMGTPQTVGVTVHEFIFPLVEDPGLAHPHPWCRSSRVQLSRCGWWMCGVAKAMLVGTMK